MGLFRTKSKSQPNGNAANYREPIQGNRKVSWDKASHRRRPSDLDFDIRRQPVSNGLLSDVTRNQDHSQMLQMSNIDEPLSTASRRRSHQTDTTSRVRHSEARMIRVRKSDVFSSKPRLRYNDSPYYDTMPDGRFPTLKGQPKSAFVDQLADELDTHQLRGALDTDSRRRKRRQSARESRRIQPRETPANDVHVTPTRSRTTVNAATPVSTHWQLVETTNAPADEVETIKVPPVTTAGQALPPASTLGNSAAQYNAIPGPSEGWQDGDSCIAAGPSQKEDQVPEPEVLLAGNRQSFPDFAVVDRRNLVRQSSGSGFLTTAWSSLWRRASTARTKKEHDVAQHRTNTLEKANNTAGSWKSVGSPTRSHKSSLPFTQVTNSRPMSGSSSVLYETLDDLPQTISGINRGTPFAYTPTYANVGDEVPTDAFYDPSIVSRTGSRAAHSRNFSRPTNDSSQGRYSRMSTQHPVTSTKLEAQEKPFFSPLLNGGTFPKPERRLPSNSCMEASDNSSTAVIFPKTPPTSNRDDLPPTGGFSTPALAAGIGRMTVTSPTIPQTPVSLHATQDYIPSTTLTYNKDIATPPSTAEPAFPPSSRSLHSLQSLDSEGSWLVNHKSEIDDAVRRSFSRNDKSSHTSIHSALRSPLKRPVSAGSTLRAVITSDDSDTEPSLAQSHVSGREGSETDEHLESPADQDFEDDAEYEQGIWRTGIGKPVQVVTSPLRGNAGPVIIDRSQLGQADNDTRRDSEDAQLSRRASVAGELDTADDDRQQSAVARPNQVIQHASYMTSMNSFHTADVFSTSQSAASSRATLTETNYQ